MFERILVTNRGEIACRIIRTCKRLGIHAVTVYSDADARALHVRQADSAEYIGPSPAAESYLNIDAVLDAAARSGAQAIHPGYGFLSENADFAEACAATGVVFIGPSPEAIRAMGDKVNARRLMSKAGVPVVPGYDGSDGRAQAIEQALDIVGLPLMVKAAAGGGGRGMRIVRTADELRPALEGASREAAAAFGDGRLFLERLIEGGRHVEAQVFGDSQGNVVFLGERDCSIQRRHQKVVEESPSPAVDDALRARISEAAIGAARAVNYTNAGTVEFLLAPDGDFYFLEMNTRLQVEHPITEERYGVDLVEWQLRVASGEPLPEVPEPHGHAIEFRLYAEDPLRDFLSSSGAITDLMLPSAVGKEIVRIDQGYETGDTVSAYYDSLLAKLVVGGATREEAVRSSIAALGQTIVSGVESNAQLLYALASNDSFAAGEYDVGWLERSLAANELDLATPPEALILAVIADLGTGAAEPWSSGAWRPSGVPLRLRFVVDGQEQTVGCLRAGPATWRLTVSGQERHVSLEEVRQLFGGRRYIRLDIDGEGWGGPVVPRPDGMLVATDRLFLIGRPAAQYRPGAAIAGSSARDLTAPLPGVIVKVLVEEGDSVSVGETIIVLEAMKMEHALKAPRDARIQQVLVEEGQRVEEGAVLITFEDGEESESS